MVGPVLIPSEDKCPQEKKMIQQIDLKANLAMVMRGDFAELRQFADGMETLLSEHPSVQLVHKHISASKLWIKEGEAMNDDERNGD